MNKENNHIPDFTSSCPIPISEYERVLLAHGGGGKLSAQLFEKMIRPQFANPWLDLGHDGAMLELEGRDERLAFSTDSYVIQPIFFPGGNIGELAVYGTVNDLTCCGARPSYLSLGLIIEEGLEMETLWKIIRSIREAADRAGVRVVTGDTKVVDRGKGDQIFINTSGIGMIPGDRSLSPRSCRPGDRILVSGRLAEHGIAIMSTRAGLAFESPIVSDCAPLNGLAERIFEMGARVRVLRDPTRGGLASTLNELSHSCGYRMRIREDDIPLAEQVKGACEILGLDPLYIANEGKLVVIVPPAEEEKVLGAMRNDPLGKEAACIGEVLPDTAPLVELETTIGSLRIVDMISGEQLPRIC